MQAWLLDATPPGMGGSSIGVLFAIQAIGSASGPIISGTLADRYGLMAVFYFLAFTIIVANMFIFFTPLGTQHRFSNSGGEERVAGEG
jgi:MFS family permease